MAEPGEGAFLGGLREILSDTLDGVDLFDPNFLAIDPADIFESLPLGIQEGLSGIRASIAETAGETVATIVTGMLSGLLKTLDVAGQGVGISLGVLSAYNEVGKQTVYRVIQPNPLDPTTLIPMVFRGQLNFESWIQEIRNNGVSEDRGAQLLAASQPILSPADVLSLLRRKDLTEPEARDRLGQLGFDPQPLEEMLRGVPQFLDSNSQLAMWLRKEITESELDERLAQLGLEERERTTLKTLAFFIPPVQDLVRFAVREAFEPELAESLGFTEGLPAAFVEAAGLQGVSEDWALKYWISHWVFPSTGQILEMFQRDVISPEEVGQAMKALDIAPKWQQFLIDIAYLPMGRIDIRRAYRLGVLSEEDMVTRYRHTGYSPEDAEILTRFTVLDVNDSLIGQGEARLTTLFRERFLTEAEFRDFLARQGRTQAQIDLLVSTQILIREADLIKDLANALQAQFNKRLMTLAQAAAELLAIGIPPSLITEMLREWQEKRESRVTLLGLADIKKAIKKGLLTEAEARIYMAEKGLRPKDIDIFIKLQPTFADAEDEAEPEESVEDVVADAVADAAGEPTIT